MSVRVPKSKVKEYRVAVRRFVEKRFALKTEFEEGSALIMVLVPKNKVEEYKSAIKQLVEMRLRDEKEDIMQGFKELTKFSSRLGQKMDEKE
ncbi:MAG: hypothetical protein ACFFC1_03280 [Promethearchaeota archaeon]